MSEARQRELESLLEKGVISDSAFDSINALLPAESPLSGPAPRSNNPTPAPPADFPAATAAPPSYAQSTASPPSLPARNNSAAPPPPPQQQQQQQQKQQPPPPPPEKPVLVYARALYRYTAGDARDCSFERDDRLAVHEYMNADWWLGKNLRTGQEGIFPRNYVVVVEEAHQKAAQPPPAPVASYQQPQYAAPAPGGGGGGYPVSPVPVHGYAAAPPPGQQGEESGGSKLGEHGKKFGKKLGNAAIFGAGATIGSNIVNSIF
ncbi:SH3 domain-containing protein [Thermothelomyces heterothallicus CBS 202.75]|uniref:SH3 domain-containing protein n=1 Tax=Thermothelomyces heterothallicus CBS 202.75 TaxID=1149848 RepID=UPI0037422477